MREIVTPKGEVYMRVEANEEYLRLQLAKHNDLWIQLDAKVIPQLASLLKEAEFFKVL